MASSSSDRDRPDADDYPTNPFVAFRRFADSQMSSLMNNVFGIMESSPVRRQRAIDEYESMLKRSREMSADQPKSQTALDRKAEQMNEYAQNPTESSSQTETDPPRCPWMMEHGLDDRWNKEEVYDNESNMTDQEPPYDDTSRCILDGLRRLESEKPKSDDTVHTLPFLGVAYMHTSPYSPVNLEQEERFKKHSGKLRAAFADLLAYQQEETLLSDNTVQTNAQMTPSDWLAEMTGMIIFGRGKALGGWNRFYPQDFPPSMIGLLEQRDRALSAESENSCCDGDVDVAAIQKKMELLSTLRFLRRAEIAMNRVRRENEDKPEVNQNQEEFCQWKGDDDEQQQARGEDDDYLPCNDLLFCQALMDQHGNFKDFEGETDERGTAIGNEPCADLRGKYKESEGARVEKQSKVANQPSILSTLTTTEQRTLPDGTVTTKVVLKKRFSDGAEEVTENFHTQNAPLSQKLTSMDSRRKQESTSQEPKAKKRSGWFWS